MGIGEDVRGAEAAVWRRADLGPLIGGYARVPPIRAVEVAYWVAFAGAVLVLALGSACREDGGKPAATPESGEEGGDDRTHRATGLSDERPGPGAVRTFTFRYHVEVPAVPEGTGPIDLFVPLALSDDHQQIIKTTIDASIDGAQRTEEKYGNRFWHGHLDRSDGRPITVSVEYLVRRSAIKRSDLTAAATAEELALFLGPNERVPVSGDLIDRVRAELPDHDGTPLGRARAIYDHVIDTMEYKKTGTGWGNGDTYWACSKRYGNCTDFHALFISLARAEGIPARFEIGFPIREDQPGGRVGGYHCWVEFHIGGIGWIPIDASEAWKHPDKRDRLFGSQPADRFRVTIGRDLELGEGHTTRPLNYFVYPHLEIGGKKTDDYKAEFSYGPS